MNNKKKQRELIQALLDGYEAELDELSEVYGCTNVRHFYYSAHRGTWILQFNIGEDQEFDTKKEMMDWIANECLQE